MASFRKRGKVWYYQFIDGDGVKRERRGCPDRRETEALARAAEGEAARARAGLADPFEAHRKRVIAEHVEDYLGFLRSKAVVVHRVGLLFANHDTTLL